MSSYMYNPSKQVTSLLSEYLEFDEEQLNLGIWSGRLALKDVNLKADAIYPHLNQIFAQAETQNDFTKSKPPLRVKLVSGTIGELNLNIPWKSLVWGQGDVKVELRNVVIVVTLESLQETHERMHKNSVSGDDYSETSTSTSPLNDLNEKENHTKEDQATKSRKRYQKQKVLREAERRQLQGREIANWLERIYKKEEEERQRQALRAGDPLASQENRMRSWLKGATNDFFWRFYAGLQSKIENLKIIVVQDTVEVGVIIPSIHVVAGKAAKAYHSNRRGSASSDCDDDTSHDEIVAQSVTVDSKPPQNLVYESAYEDGEHVDKHIKVLGFGVYVRKVSGKKKVGEMERVTGEINDYMVQVSDVSTKEYVLRPTELNISFSLFYPYPPEKRKKKIERIKEASQPSSSASVATESTTNSAKRRRGKREKSSVASESTGGPPTEPSTPTGGHSSTAESTKKEQPSKPPAPAPDAKPKRAMVMRRMSIQTGRRPMAQPIAPVHPEIAPAPQTPGDSAAQSQAGSSTQQTHQSVVSSDQSNNPDVPRQGPPQLEQGQARPRFARRSSIAGPVKGSSAAAAVVSRVPKAEQKVAKRHVPLARRDDLASTFSAASSNNSRDLTARLDGNVRVGPVQIMMSTKHYNLIDTFISAGARMRNGRPSQTISSVLNESAPIKHSFVLSASDIARATSVTTIDAQPVNLGLSQPRCERSQVVRSWWRYSLYAVQWEIKQRRKVRKHFQDKYLSFSWERQHYRRKEYVKLFIAAKLLSPEEPGALATNSSAAESLASIEDELAIEQILLYRSIARLLHVGREREMPDSLVSIRASAGYRGRSSDDKPILSNSGRSLSRSSSHSSEDGLAFDHATGNDRTILSMLEEGCEISRLRIERGHTDILPRHRALVKYDVLERKHGMEESTIGMTLDTRTAGRGGAGFSRGGTRSRGTTRSSDNSSSGNDNSMKFSFTASMEKVELNVVEEELKHEGYTSRVDANDDSSRMSMTISEISELTDDDRFSDSATQVTGLDDDSASDQILQSTDFLLFRQPEKVLLRMEIRNVSCSALGSASGSRNLNFKINQILASTGENRKLLELGMDSDGLHNSDSALGDRDANDVDQAGNEGPRTALSLSLVLQKDQQVVECDVARIKACYDFEAIHGLLMFGSSFKSTRPLIPPTPGESVRMYVVEQNTGSAFRFFDASFRLHGFEVNLPQQKKKEKDRESDLEATDSGSDTNPGTETSVMLLADMVEVYSGKAANDLGIIKPHWQETYNAARLSVLGEEEPRQAKIRRLQMLDVDELISKKSAFMAFNVVAAISGLDFVASSSIKGGIEEKRLSFFDAPVDVEMFGSVNESSVLDYNRAKREIVVKVSDVHTMISESRLQMLSDIIPRFDKLKKKTIPQNENVMAPPRLEILARLMMSCVDLNVSRLRFSLMTDDQGRVGHAILSKSAQLVDFVTSFLRTVGKLDLSWPHEEALSSAMQICIDRLTGIGFQLDDAWQCANTALLNFLEDITTLEDPQENESPDDALDVLIHKSVARTVPLFEHRFEQSEGAGQMVENHLVVDFPEGLQLTAIDLFYDHHTAIVVNSVFITNGEGIHLLRLMPEVGQPEEESQKQDSDARSDAAASFDDDSFSASTQSTPALIYRLFQVNEKFSFGRGGLPLSALGGEIDEVTHVQDESLLDVDMGELELLFCEDVFDDVLYAISNVLAPLEELAKSKTAQKPSKQPASDHVSPCEGESKHVLVNTSCVSLLFTNDELVPFTRLILGNCVTTAESSFCDGSNITKLSAKQISMLYLAPDGELYPEQVCAHEMSAGPPLAICLESTREDSKCIVELRGTRIFMVYQYVAECYQYFYSGTVGLGLWIANSAEVLAKLQPEHETESPSKSTSMEFHLFDCSLLIPRSSLSSEMISVEIEHAKISFEDLFDSFSMPTQENCLHLNPVQTADGGSAETSIDQAQKRQVSRTIIEMERFRIFSSMMESGDARDPEAFDSRENLAFNCFFEIDGRAEPNKQVYHQIAPPQNYEIEREKAERHWREMTSNSATLKIIADYAPHLRILVSDDLNGTKTPLSLDVTLSQFCLLMSCWYNNMSELPIMFPVSATDIVVGSKFIADASTFPEFGSEQYREVMESFHPPTSEFVMSLSRLSLRCTTDKSFDTVTTEAKGILLGLDECTIHVVSDSLGLTKVGAGSLGARLIDDDKVHCKIVDVNNRKELMHSWADLTFGTGEECTKFVEDLPLPFQMSIFLAPNASLYNIGMDSSILMMSDFSTLFGFLGFISVYFCESELGYPYLRAMEFLNETKQGMMGEDEIDETTSESLTDFRLWLSRPAVWIPVEPTEFASPFLILATEKGIWYRCATIELFLSQECIVKALTMSFVDKEDAEHRASLSLSRSLTLGKSLVEGLSLGLRIDYSGATNHSDYSLKIPYNGEWDCNLTSQRISMDPVVVSKPTICKPVETVDRFLGPAVCEMTFVVDVLPAAFAALYNLFIGAAEESGSDGGSQSQAQAESAIASESDHEETEEEDTEAIPEATFSFAGGFGDLRVFVLDPVLGPHLPVAVLSVASLNVTASQFSSEALEEEPVRGEAPPGDLQVYVDGNVWADSFKLGLTRSWEPLLESYHFILFYEKSLFRGSGITLTSDTSLHLNVTGAMLLVVDEVADSMLRVVSETFDSTNSGAPSEKSDHRRSETRERCITCTDDVSGLSVVHEFPRAVSNEDRVAFSVKNMTGQRMRAYRFENGGLDSKVATVSYVENGMATKLLFQPSVSKVSNMKVVEVEFPGLENSPNHNNAGSGSVHAIDIQIPGFQWMREVQIDNFGRRFIDLTPRSSLLRERAKEDWRIANVMKLLVEVGLENGGRELTAKSIFSIVNKTTHTLSLVLHPNTSFSPDIENEADVQLETGSIHQIPVLLLESALRMAGGMELGCIWLRPSNGQLPSTFTTDGHDDEPLVAQFSSRPVRLGKTVSDSALLFDENKGLDIPPERAETGIQVSCPVIGGSGQRELAPFCYAVEVGRSPVVKARQREHRKNDKNEMVNLHGPVAYTLSVYAPFVVANLLPEPGRFELMHAVRKTVLWFADLEPGQQVSVHSVGLDAPLLLLINLRFCRTPIGEGALVHHGVDPPPEAREHLGRLRSIGKAGKAVTMQLGKTLTALGESPDKRGHDRLYLAQNKENQPIHDKKGHHNTKRVAKVSAGDSATEDVDGKTYRVDTTIFFPENCVDETVVVDGVGQRLTLGIENIRGGGGQRRISVYCPFWIINTTEHALAYRQERSKTFVSGSVVSPKMDGSLTLSGGHVGEKAKKKAITEYESSSTKPLNNGTIFAGTPGALATSPGRCELTPGELTHLLEEDLSLDDLSSLAFMFNFHEGSMPGGYQKLCVRLHDGTGLNRYQSDWSRGFTLDSVGISQVVDMNCKDARALELTMVTQNAPGHLFKYTKILRFLPRYVVVNNLPYPVRLWQDNSIFRPPSAADVTLVNSEKKGSTRWRLVTNRKKKDTGKINQYEALWGKQVDITAEEGDVDFPLGTTAHPSALHVMSANTSSWKPFNLPDTRGDRQLRIGLGGHYNLTSSISADVPGEHTLRVTRAVDLRLLKHVSTRASPEYSITLPPRGETSFSGELGIWFETEWGTDRSLIVKAIRNDSYCYNKTDVHVGDELLLIDAAPVTRMTFAEAMNVLRTRINEIKTTPSEPPRRASSMRRSSLSFRFGSSTQSATKQEQEPERTIITPLTLTFRTVEERLRRVRLKAARNSAAKDQLQSETSSSNGANHGKDSDSHKFIKAELKTLHKCMYLVLGTTGTVPYEVHNRTKNSTIYFRQRGCHNHQWRILKPGASELYCWEEPMKTKRLTVRVATEESFVFFSQNEPSRVGAEEEYNSVSELDAHASKVAENGRAVAKKRKRIKDEEEAVFSSSTSVRLEEIGFKDYLHYRSAENKPRQLELEVDVVGSTRVLLVRDSSTELNNENQLVAHLETLRDKCAEEEERYQELRDLRSELPSTENLKDMSEDDITSSRVITDTARNLMQDYPEEKTLTSCHQMVVEVLEATGLSPDNYVGVCNPYVEVYLQKGSSGRKNLFQRRKSQRTYYVRRSVNPQWNSQSFIFNVPEEAVSVTRGHAVKLKVRNFRRMGTHSVLGRAQIDLHSVRGHSPLLGWFPLAGRTGRRELENSLSHWGRGSVKLKIHWVYSTSGLLDYFLLLSEARLKDLNESVDGMAGQVEKWREEEQRRQERIDGFKAVRVNDLVPVHRKQSTPGNFQPPFMRMESELGTSVRPIDEYGVSIDENVAITFDSQDDSAAFSSGRMAARKSVIAHGQLPSIRNEVEDQISLRRQQLQMGTSLATQNMRSSVFVSNNTGNFGGTASLSRFRTWEEAKVFFNDESLEIDFDGQEWNLSLRRTSPKHSFSDDDSVGERQLAGKLKVPSGAPSLIKDAAENHAALFAVSRASVERFARSSLRAALNPGGWLTIRPIQALNLPDTCNGMFVKVRYGSETYISETVDSTVYPTWFNPDESSTDGPVSAESLEYFPGDLHVYVPPQKTSGSILISVVGEGQGQRVNVKSELGVLKIPLGAAITACVDSVEEYFDSQMNEHGTSPVYMRWFPLEDPKATQPIEGDRRAGSRPREAEKDSDHTFNDYFSPCIQLALFWNPEVDFPDGERDGPRTRRKTKISASNEELVASTGEKSAYSSVVDQYFNADIGQVSVALIDSRKAVELVSGCVCDIDVRYWVTKAKTRFGVSVGWFQLDQQDEYAREPIILAPTPSEYVATVFQILAVKDNLRSKNEVLSFEFIDFSIAEFDLTLEETLLSDIADFLSSLRLRGFLADTTSESDGATEDLSTISHERSLFELGAATQRNPESALLFLLSDDNDEMKGRQRVYIEQLFLGVVKFNLSYLKGTKETRVLDDPILGIARQFESDKRAFGLQSSHHEKSDLVATWSQNTAQSSGGKFSLPTIFTSLFPNVSDAPVRLQGKALNHVFESPREIIQSIKKFYVNETLKQIYKIIGSLDFVGNPTMLFTSFLSGLRDLILIPSQAFIQDKNASSVGLGVAKGTLSLFSHSTSGFFGFTSKIFAVAGQALASVSFDKDYRQWHREQVVVEASNLNRTWKKRGVQSVHQMIVRPLGDILLGVGSGITGIVVAPVRGYKRGGPTGFIIGLAAGAAGVFVRPAVGVLDALSHFTASIHDIARSVNVLDKRFQPPIKYRLPYVFGTRMILMSFDDSVCRAFHLLKRFPLKTKHRAGHGGAEIIVHVEVLHNIGIDTYAIVTSSRLIIIRLVSGSNSPTLCWQVSLVGNAKVSSQVAEHGHNGFALTVFLKERETQEVDPSIERSSGPDSLPSNGPGTENEPSVGHGIINSAYEPGTEAFDHGTSRSEAGELITWYSVVAEYQYRRQLARLHNGIACVTGNFDDVIRDQTLGRPGSTQFFTSFGIFHFEEKDSESLEQEAHASTLEDQMEAIPWRLDEDVVANDPEWLAIARKRAANASLEVPVMPLSAEQETSERSTAANQPSSGRVRKIARWITGRLPTIPDTDEENPPSPIRHDKGAEDGGMDSEDVGGLSPSVPNISNTTTGDETFVTANGETNSGNQSSTNSGNTPSFNTARQEASERNLGREGSEPNLARESFATALTAHGLSSTPASTVGRDSFITAYQGNSALTMDVSIQSDPSDHIDNEEDVSLERQGFISSKLPSKLAGASRNLSDQTAIHSNATPARTDGVSEIAETHTPTHVPSTDTERLVRMETIMEQLLIFSSEQALQNNTTRTQQTPSVANDLSLRGEIHELRMILQQQNQAEKEAQKEIELLRMQVNKLTEIVQQRPQESDQSSIDSNRVVPASIGFEEQDDIMAKI